MEVQYSKSFKKNYKKYVQNNSDLRTLFIEYTSLIELGRGLPEKAKDHQLKHQVKGMRDFHLSSDMVTVYYLVRSDNVVEYIYWSPLQSIQAQSNA